MMNRVNANSRSATAKDDALKVVRQLMSRLVELDVIRAWHHHHYDATVFALLDGTSELRSFRPKLADCGLDVVAHQGD